MVNDENAHVFFVFGEHNLLFFLGTKQRLDLPTEPVRGLPNDDITAASKAQTTGHIKFRQSSRL
eukprot:scaffold2871_cov163-Amphora_coffeaeformis.AAC.6